jgi:hypothetical protein
MTDWDGYQQFLASKAPKPRAVGFEPGHMHSAMREDQKAATAFAIRQGRAGLFLDTGMGKTFNELEWCKQCAEASNGYALLLTPLAVARQIEREANRWGYDARVIREQSDARPGINICNYDRLDNLDPCEFGAVALDESSILKSFTGATTRALIAAFEGHRFKLCATATPAPNDHMELGQHAQFLGIMPSNEMLARWFMSDQTEMGRYRLKKAGESAFWDWMASWSRCAETPADLGFDATGFDLPPLHIIRHKVAGDVRRPMDALFLEELSATNIHEVKRQTAESRAQEVASKVNSEPAEPWIIWCDTDYEADCLRAAIPGAIEVRGSQPADKKEAALAAFSEGKTRVLISKPSVCGQGMNWQHCARVAYVGRSFSYEAWYQSVRRCWRYGQTREVEVHLMVAEGEEQIGRVIDRKANDHGRMKRAMVAAMARCRETESVLKVAYNPTTIGRSPSWLKSVA